MWRVGGWGLWNPIANRTKPGAAGGNTEGPSKTWETSKQMSQLMYNLYLRQLLTPEQCYMVHKHTVPISAKFALSQLHWGQ